jgi:hypothetical protein
MKTKKGENDHAHSRGKCLISLKWIETKEKGQPPFYKTVMNTITCCPLDGAFPFSFIHNPFSAYRTPALLHACPSCVNKEKRQQSNKNQKPAMTIPERTHLPE